MIVPVEDEPAGIACDPQPGFLDVLENFIWIPGSAQRIGFVVDPSAENVRADVAFLHARADTHLDGKFL